MPANTAPIFTLLPAIEWSNTNITAANTTTDLTSGTVYDVFTASTNGSYVQKIRFRHLGTNVATVVRVFINNGSATTTVANNSLWDEITIAANTVSQTAAATNYELPLNFALPPSYRIYVTTGTILAAGLEAVVIGGDY